MGVVVDADNGYAVASSHGARNRRDREDGAALIYRRSPDGGWRELTALTPEPNDASYFGFGYTVGIGGGVIAVGSKHHRKGAPAGLYIYEQEAEASWRLVDSFDFERSSEPSSSMILDVVVSESAIVTTGINSGLTLLERRPDGSWELTEDFENVPTAANFEGDPEFWLSLGQMPIVSVAMEGDTIAAGYRSNKGIADTLSHVRVFRRNAEGGWLFSQVIAPPDGVFSIFGDSLAIDSGRLLIGPGSNMPVYGRADDGSYYQAPGAAYVYELVPEPHSAALVAVLVGGVGVGLRRA